MKGSWLPEAKTAWCPELGTAATHDSIHSKLSQPWLTYVLDLAHCKGQLAAQREDSLMHRAGQKGELGQLAQVLAVHGRLHT